MDQLSRMAKMLEDAGYITKTRKGFEPTPRACERLAKRR